MLDALSGLADNRLKAAVIIGKKLIANKCVVTSSSRYASEPEKIPALAVETPPTATNDGIKAHRERYGREQEEREREEGIRDNPSLDVETQQAIITDYRALHEQIKAEGLYQCRYSEYAKESIRYGLLFAAFATLLYCKWYLTSAIFLGLFWVC